MSRIDDLKSLSNGNSSTNGKTNGKKTRIQVMNAKTESNRVIKANPKSDGQRNVLRAIDKNTVTIINGIPGTGKTYLAVSYGLQMLMREKYKRIIITRPYVEAGEHLGFLPGSYEDKTAPYLIPIFDAFADHMTMQDIQDLVTEGKIMVLPLAYMRGVTFKEAYVVCDEAQNATFKQLHMVLTRIGQGSKVVLTGDITQSDIGLNTGLKPAIECLEGADGVEVVTLDRESLVRDPIVAEIDRRFIEFKGKKAAG